MPKSSVNESVTPLAQDTRPAASIPLVGPDLTAGNANWTAGLFAESEWIWSGNLIPAAFENNLSKFLLQIPGAFEEQLPHTTTLIFDEPSFRNGHQMSGFLDRVTRELVISYIAQRRRAWYTMTHHALLGALTARKHGVSDADIGRKWSQLLDFQANAGTYTRVERAALRFADAFATNPKAYADADYAELRAALRERNAQRFAEDESWLAALQAARRAEAAARGSGKTPQEVEAAAANARRVPPRPPDQAAQERQIDAQVVELAFLSLQFVALADVFTALNIPDEPGLAAELVRNVPPEVIARVNALNALGGRDLGELTPPVVDRPIPAIAEGRVRVAPVLLRGTRVPLVSWETAPDLGTRDKGLAVGGVHVGVLGWANGQYAPGGLGLLVLNHPELARKQPPYSLPLLFDEDEWRNGVNTAGFVDRRLKELAIMKVYHSTRNRYGIEHHTMFLLGEYAREYGVAPPDPPLTGTDATAATARAHEAFTNVMLHLAEHRRYADRFSSIELALLDWTDAVVHQPHQAHRFEPALRTALEEHDRRQVTAGVRRLDGAGGDDRAAYRTLVDHQIAELAMIIGHMDGLGRVFSILHIEGEAAVQIAAGRSDPDGFVPTLDARGHLQLTGYFNNRPGILELLAALGVPETVLTANELLLNPEAAADVRRRLDAGEQGVVSLDARQAGATAEF
jgi:alkylhydroperoxidase family enzyme